MSQNCFKNVLKSLYGFGRCCQEIRDICMGVEPCLKVHTLISVQHKSIQPGQNLMMIDPSQHDLSCGGVKLSIG